MTAAKRSTGSIALVVEKFALGDQTDEFEYWLGVPPADRVAAVEILRQRMYGGDNATRLGLQRFSRTLHR
jgi:hypothetical protein